MEAQGQQPSTAAFFAPNYPRKAPRLAAAAGTAPSNHINDTSAVPTVHAGYLPGAIPRQQELQMFINGTAMLSGEPESELTCNASGHRKRAFDGDLANTILQPILQPRQTPLCCVPHDVSPVKAATAAAAVATAYAGIPSLEMTYDKTRLHDSAMTSTSGRPPAGEPLSLPSAIVAPPLMEQLVLQLYCQSLAVDAFIRHQNERIRSGLEQGWKRHQRALLSAMEQGFVDRLREKEAELESAIRRNAELEEKIRQLASENQIWINVARSKEAIVSSLRAALEQVQLQNPIAQEASTLAIHLQGMEEGFGESDSAAPLLLPADDAESCCYGGDDNHDAAAAAGEVRRRSACKVCGKREDSTLLLPCRHLCVCERCDGRIDACPVCGGAKSASLRVFLC